MPADPNRPIELTICHTEAEAAMILAVLDAAGIHAEMVGGLTSGLRAEAPGPVTVLVRTADLQRARDALERRQDQA